MPSRRSHYIRNVRAGAVRVYKADIIGVESAQITHKTIEPQIPLKPPYTSTSTKFKEVVVVVAVVVVVLLLLLILLLLLLLLFRLHIILRLN